VLEEALRTANIPYRIVGGTSYFDRKEIADAAAYLRLVVQPRDEIALRRVINYPTRGIGRTTVMKLVETARAWGVPVGEVLERAGEVEEIGRAPAEALARFAGMLTRARAGLAEVEAAVALAAGGPTLEEWVRELLREIRLEEAVRAENKSERTADARVDNLREFVSAIGTYERRTWGEMPLPDEEADWSPPTLAGFLERVSLISEEEPEQEESDGQSSVTLLTLHSAKGLEFPHVFLVGLEEEILPHARSVNEIAEGSSADPIAEERRLFYVGITRARHRLTLSGCRTRRRGGELLTRQPSRFVREIPTELLEARSPSAESSLDEGDRKELRENFFAHMKEMLG
jgi:DNA helicase-2/ATP-dependent DNA helicase PcrA